jgi:hypothetical protein
MTANKGAYPQAVQFDLFRRLIPALITASQLHARFEQLRDTINYQSAVMDNGIYPVWLVDRAGKMLYASTQAEHYQRARHRTIWSVGADTLSLIQTAKNCDMPLNRPPGRRRVRGQDYATPPGGIQNRF